MPTVLDNQKTFSLHDSKNMLGAVEGFPEFMNSQLLVPPSTTRRGWERSVSGYIVLMGMGGSASAGDLVLDWLSKKIHIPAILYRDANLPRFAGSETLVIS